MNIRIEDLRDRHCRWPIGEPGDEKSPMRYCGATRIDKNTRGMPCPYCATHAAMAYTAPEARREAA